MPFSSSSSLPSVGDPAPQNVNIYYSIKYEQYFEIKKIKFQRNIVLILVQDSCELSELSVQWKTLERPQVSSKILHKHSRCAINSLISQTLIPMQRPLKNTGFSDYHPSLHGSPLPEFTRSPVRRQNRRIAILCHCPVYQTAQRLRADRFISYAVPISMTSQSHEEA